MEENKEETKKLKQEKLGFFKTLWYSITKVEKYPEMSAIGNKKALKYLAGLIAILTLITCLGVIYQTNKMVGQTLSFVETELPEFSYKEGTLSSEANEPIILEKEDLGFGKIIINLNELTQENKDEYTTQIKEYGSGILVLKDKVILENIAVEGETEYSYQDAFSQVGMTEFTKQDLISYAKGNGIYNLYLSLFLTMFIYSFIIYAVSAVWTCLVLSALGYLVTWISKMKMRFVAIFNMSIYALTLSILLNIIYVVINIFTTFAIEYFQVMYMSVAFIYLIAAIFIIRAEFIKKQVELTKVEEVQKQIKDKIEQEKEEQKEQKEKQERKKKDKEEEKKKKEGEEPEGSEV